MGYRNKFFVLLEMCYYERVMGQIIIDLPSRIKRHYRLDNSELESVIIESLEMTATPVKTNPVRLTDEDKADLKAANRARKGELIDWEDAKIFLDQLN